MALVMSGGGDRSLISMRVALTPQGSVAASMALSRRELIDSRWDSTSSRFIEPTTVRRLVMLSWLMALVRLATR